MYAQADLRNGIGKLNAPAARVEVGSNRRLRFSDKAEASVLQEAFGDTFDPGSRAVTIVVRLGRRGGSMRMLDPTGRRIIERAEPNPVLIDAIAKGWRWRALLVSGAYPTSSALASAEGVTQTGLHHFLRLGYLAPDLMREILEGRQRPGLTLDQLSRDLPLSWAAQRRRFSANADI